MMRGGDRVRRDGGRDEAASDARTAHFDARRERLVDRVNCKHV